MKLLASESYAHASGKVMSNDITIGNTNLIAQHLVKTIYSNPKLSICREILSNCRDAHREIGEPNKPCTVIFPNAFESSIHFIDYGPGIDPERFNSIFNKIGNSTKRDDNTQTGGYGMGSKTPFSYVNTYIITTIAMEGSNKVKRQYACVNADKMSTKEMGEPEIITDPSIHTGTDVSFEVNEKDWNDFKVYVVNVTQFWDVKPELKGQNIPKYQDFSKPIFTGNNWSIVDTSNYYMNQSIVCVDGIPYPLDANALEVKDQDLSNILRTKIVLLFGVGELSLSLSRENLQYDARTKVAIISRLEEIRNDIKNKLCKEIIESSNLIDATIKYYNLYEQFHGSIIPKLSWNAMDLRRDSYVCLDAKYSTSVKFRYRKIRRSGRIVLAKEITSTICVGEKNIIYVINDEVEFDVESNSIKSINKKKLLTLLESYPEKTIVIMCFKNDALTPAYKNDIGVEKMNWIKLSSIKEKEIVRIPGVSGKRRAMSQAYKWNQNSFNCLNNDLCKVEVDLVNGTGYYIIARGSFYSDFRLGNKRGTFNFINKCNQDVYIFSESQVKRLGAGWKHVSDFIAAKYDELLPAAIKIAEHNSKVNGLSNYNMCEGYFKQIYAMVGKDINKDSPLHKWNELSKVDENYKEYDEQYKLLQSILCKPDITVNVTVDTSEIKKIKEICENRYSLISNFGHSFIYSNSKDKKKVVEYIDLLDAKYNS